MKAEKARVYAILAQQTRTYKTMTGSRPSRIVYQRRNYSNTRWGRWRMWRALHASHDFPPPATGPVPDPFTPDPVPLPHQ